MSRGIEAWQMTSSELDEVQNYISGLPANARAREDALKAWRAGGPAALNAWRIALDRKQKIKPISLLATESYHGTF